MAGTPIGSTDTSSYKLSNNKDCSAIIFLLTFKKSTMKMQLTSLLLLAGASLIIFTGCKKNDNFVSPSAQSAATYDEAVQGAQTLKFNAEVPAKWYALAIT